MDIRLDLLAWSFGVGVGAFFNPCGFAMLPAYVAHYLGRSSSEESSQVSVSTLLNGLSLGGVVSGGFITTFAILGMLISFIGSALGTYIHWISTLLGVGLIVLGLMMLFGRMTMSIPALERLADRITASSQSAGQSKGLPFYYAYGIAYAVASIGCTFPLFFVVVNNAFQVGFVNGVIQFGAYAVGMSVMMLALSVAMVTSKDLIQRIMPVLMQGVRWIGGPVVMIAGAYLIYYNVFYAGLISL